jgi:OFA family oxalate/formate antiporter-like MFS transporter
MQWFPSHKGLVTGLAVAGFGGGAVLLSFVADHLLRVAGWDVLMVFRFLGVVCGAAALGSALLLCAPPSASSETCPPGRQQDRIGSYVLSLPFLLLCVGMFAGTFAGLLAVGNLKPLILAAGLPMEIATLAISVFALGNAIGRVAWGQVHDRVASRKAILMSLALLAVALFPLLFALPASLMLLAIWCCGCGFGACFVVYPAAVVQRFGVERFPRLYPLCFLGYGLAGLIAPGLGGRIADATGSYAAAVALCLVTLVVAILAIGLASMLADSVWAPAEDGMAEYAES